MLSNHTEQIIRSRKELMREFPQLPRSPDAAEGGCGVVGLAANVPIPGRHVLAASWQMHNRGNGKGGGISMVGLDPQQMRVDAETLRTHTLLQIALLDPSARPEVEAQFITPSFDVAQSYQIDQVDNFRTAPGLEVRPPDVWRYFVRVKPAMLERFAQENKLTQLAPRALEDEFVYQNSFKLNLAFYASLGEQRAFVLSHGRDLIVLKIVGYAEQVVEYYQLQDQTAHVWIAHQRYPTKGRVWHPGGAHPFIGLNEALVHNGDFANYHAVSQYLKQRNMTPLFLTDTEVSVQLFDLWDRVYRYPLEVTLEAMAPTTEYDLSIMPPEKQALYQAIQRTHIHGSPDGPWFFILARSLPDEDCFELLGITDTSMLRPQVFALYENTASSHDGVKIGLIASERQAINACLRSLAAEDERFQPVADRYWVARGGSHTDGGSFRFSVSREGDLTCTNKFGEKVTLADEGRHFHRSRHNPAKAPESFRQSWQRHALYAHDDGGPATFENWLRRNIASFSWPELDWGLSWLADFAFYGDAEWRFALDTLSRMRDRCFDPGRKRQASALALLDNRVTKVLDTAPLLESGNACNLVAVKRLSWKTRRALRPPAGLEAILVMDTLDFPPEGDECAARWLVKAYQLGWQHLIAYHWRGGRFAGSGFGPNTKGLRLDLYGDVGDYAGSGLDGGEIHLHGDGQDQLGQVLKSGKLVVYGDVGQTFLYGAKGGEIYVRGSAAGRPLINAVGGPRAVINGTCLDYLAESFMAGDPHNGGGFVILNGVTFDEHGQLIELETPYPGGNLFSLASGGAIYLRDPRHKVQEAQLNGGRFAPLSDANWNLIQPYLHENERLFNIPLEALLTVDGSKLPPIEVYRKVEVRSLTELA